MLILAAFMLLCGTCSTLFYLFLPLSASNARNDVASGAIFGSSAGLGILFGVVLLWQGVNILRGRESRSAARAFPPFVFFIVALVVVIPLGLVTLNLQSFAVYLFPPWHLLAAVLPPLAFLAFAARRLGGASGLRALVTAFTWGALGATSLATIIELSAGALLLLIAALVVALTPNDQTFLEQLQSNILRMRGTLDLTTALDLFANPTVALGVLFYFAGIVPLIEETFKTLVVAFVNPQRTQLQDAVLWGIAAGVGFAIIENIFNTSAVLSIWAMTIFTRLGATTMHVANGVTMGRGWYAARVERRWDKLFIAIVTSVFFHALWNGLAIALSASALYVANNSSASTLATLPASLLMAAIALALIVLAALGMVWIAYSVRSVREPVSAKNSIEGVILT